MTGKERDCARKGNIFPDIWTWGSIFSLCTMSCKLGSPPWPQPSSRRPVWFDLHSLCRAILDRLCLQATHHSLSFPTPATPQPHLLALSCCSEQIFKNDTALFKSASPHQLSLSALCSNLWRILRPWTLRYCSYQTFPRGSHSASLLSFYLKIANPSVDPRHRFL